MKELKRTKLGKNKSFSRFISVLLFFFVAASSAFAQESVIKGRVLSTDGTGLAGAVVTVKGTTNGAAADVNGDFSIKVSSPDAVLVFTFIGYATQEIAVGSQTSVTVTMKEEGKQLNEITVTALGQTKDLKTVGYSTSEVDGSEMIKARDANSVNSLAGKISGLTVGASSEFMGTPTVVLRGNTDILYVVDGVPINSDTWNINADDIESYTVLKGPNASALYGSRGINGAIVITTKKGDGAKGTTVDFNSTDMIDPKSFLTIPKRQNEYGVGSSYMYTYANDPFNQTGAYGRQPVWGPRMEGQPVAQYNSPVVNGVRTATPFLCLGANNFVNFMQVGFHTSNNISINSVGEKYHIRISLSQVDQKGNDPNTYMNITNGNITASYNFTKKLTFEGNMNYNYQNSPNQPDAVYGPQSYTYMIQEYGSANYDVRSFKNYWASPGTPGVQQDWAEYGRANNPYFLAYQWLRPFNKTDVYGYGKVNYQITPDLNLSIRSQISGYNSMKSEDMPTSAITYSGSTGINETLPFGQFLGEYRQDRRNLYDNNNDILLTYNKSVTPDISIGALAGANYRTFVFNESWTSTQNFIVPEVYNFANTKNPLVAYNFNSGMNVASAYYSVDFGYKKYFSLNTTGRVDNSSVFPAGYQNYFYPSATLATNITDYTNISKNILSYLKLRASIANVKGGLTTPTIGPAFEALGQPSPLGYGSSYYSNYGGPSYTNQNSYTLNRMYNNQPASDFSSVLADPTLKPYSVTSREVGADFKFVNNRISLGVTYFSTLNGPIIYQQPIATSSGYTAQNVNGLTSTKNGWELDFTASPFKNPDGFSWDITANWATYQERLASLVGGATSVDINDHYYSVGDRLDAIYGYTYYRSPDGSIINVNGLPLKRTVGTQYKDLLGYANPDFVTGISNKVSYKNWSLNFQFDGRVGGKIYDEVYADMLQSGNATDLVTGNMGAARLAEWEEVKANNYAMPANFQGQYTGPGEVITSGTPTFDKNGNITNMSSLTFGPNTQKVGLQSYVGGVNGFFQEPFMISKTYFMLREVVLSYNVPKKFLENFLKGSFNKASISLVARNLLYWDFNKRKDTYLDQYAAGFTGLTTVGQTKAQADNSNGYGGNNMNLVMNAGMQTPVVRSFGLNLNFTF